MEKNERDTSPSLLFSIHEAVDILDPQLSSTENMSLTVGDLSVAYDLLLVASNGITSVCANREYCCSDGNDDGAEADAYENADTSSLSVGQLADLYRALLMCCALLLTMTDDMRKGEHDSQEESSPSFMKTNNLCLLDCQHRRVISRTGRRCLLLLRLLSLAYGEPNPSFSQGKDEDDRDWHDECLPRSSFPVLQSCFELPDRLISLDAKKFEIDFFFADDLCHTEDDEDKKYNYEGLEAAFVYSDFDSENSRNFDVNGCIPAPFLPDADELASEEATLLDIACPSSERYAATEVATICSPSCISSHAVRSGDRDRMNYWYKQKQPRDEEKMNLYSEPTGDLKKMPEGVAMHGWLVQLAHVVDVEGSPEASRSIRRRYCRLDKSGLFSIQTTDKQFTPRYHTAKLNEEEAVERFLVDGDFTMCKPDLTQGLTFHFRVTHLLHIQSLNPTDSYMVDRVEKNHDEKNGNGGLIRELVFGVDEESGGGLVDGFHWVEAFQRTAQLCRNLRDMDCSLQEEWKAEWEEASMVALAAAFER